MNCNIKQLIIDRLRTTWRDNIGKVIDYMENNGFFTYHSHSHHHYPGGLAEHSWQTYQIALRLEKERCANNPNAQKMDEDNIAIASLLHDICVCSGMRDVKGHGSRSAALLPADRPDRQRRVPRRRVSPPVSLSPASSASMVRRQRTVFS